MPDVIRTPSWRVNVFPTPLHLSVLTASEICDEIASARLMSSV